MPIDTSGLEHHPTTRCHASEEAARQDKKLEHFPTGSTGPTGSEDALGQSAPTPYPDQAGHAWSALMKQGDVEGAWRVSDRVLASRDPARRDDPALAYHQRWVWDGADPRGRHVLVRCYHGLGDTLQFARYLRPLRLLAQSLTVEAPPELCALLRHADIADRIVPFVHDAPLAPRECDIEIMELAHALRIDPAALPPPYLSAAALGSAGQGAIGLCWRAGNWDAARSIPLALLAPVLAPYRVASLQPGPVPPGLAAAPCPATIMHSAALIRSLELVVTVDSMVAHLAGALNRPCLVLLKHDADWRWMQARKDRSHDCPWYPATRLLRQQAPGDWSGVVDELRDLLATQAWRSA